MEKDKKHLYNLDELTDYKVASGYHNVKGWPVKDRDNRVIGKVDDLLVNLESERVVYLDVEVDKTIIDARYDPYRRPGNPNVREFVNKDGENHIIIPIGLVDINDEHHYVYTDTVDHQTFAETPRYKNGSYIDREYEVAVLDSYNRNHDIDEDKVRQIVRDEVESKKSELQDENKIRKIVREEVTEIEHSSPQTHSNYAEIRDETLAEQRERLHRDEYAKSHEMGGRYKTSAEYKKRGLDFDHDNDGNPNITDPDYYKKKVKDIKNADYDHDNDGNPNITDPDYYKQKARDIKNADYDHDNDGNPNITDPDYYSGKAPRKPDSKYRGFYDRDEFDDRNIRKNS